MNDIFLNIKEMWKSYKIMNHENVTVWLLVILLRTEWRTKVQCCN